MAIPKVSCLGQQRKADCSLICRSPGPFHKTCINLASAASVWPLNSFTFKMAQSINMVAMTAHVQVPISCLLGPVSGLFQCRTRLCWLIVRLLQLLSWILLNCQVSHLKFGHGAISLSLNIYPNRGGWLMASLLQSTVSDPASVTHWIALFNRAGTLLQLPKRGGKRHNLTVTIKSRISSFSATA